MKCKRLIALLLLCAAVLTLAAPAAAAAPSSGDVQSGAAANMEVLRQLGILSGVDGDPDADLTRAEFCVMVIRTMGREDEVAMHTSRTIFRDVTAAHWARGYINLAASITVDDGTGSRLVSGVGTGQFKPDSPITYAQAITILVRMLGYGDAQAGAIWPNGYMNLASSLGLTDGLSVSTFASITRAQAAVLVGNALRASTSGGEVYYKTMKGVASVRSAVILDVDARSSGAEGLLRVYTASGSGGAVEDLRQIHQVSSDFVGYTGQLLLNSAGRVLGFIPEELAGKTTVLTAAAASEVTGTAAAYDLAADAVIIVGETVYDWAKTGYLQANRYLGSAVWLFCDDIGDVSCVYLPVEDPAQAAELAVASTQTVIILDTAAKDGRLMAYAVTESDASTEYFRQAAAISSAYEGRIGQLLLNARDDVVGFIPSAEAAREVTVASTKRSGIVDAEGVTHRITGSAVAIIGDSVYTWKDTGYLQIGSHTGKTVRLYCNDDGSVAYVCLFSGGTSAETKTVMAETVTAAGELARRLGITGAYSITKNGAAAGSEDLAQYDVAYYDAASGTLRASDRQFTGYIESVYPNLAEAETVTVSGNEFTVLESAWDTLADYAIGDRVTLLLTDDGKAAAATTDSKIVSDVLGILSTDGSSVKLLGSGLTMKAEKISAKETLYGSIVKVNVYQDELKCSAYTADGAGKLNISAGTLGEYELAAVCEIYEHTGSVSYKSHVYSLSGKLGEASYDFSEIIWTDSIPASYVTAYHLNSAGKVDMILLRDVTGNCYEYGEAAKYTGAEGINLGTAGLTAYNSAVTVTNADNPEGSVKRLCSLYDAKTGTYLGISAGTYNANYQRVASLTVLKKAENVERSDFFLLDETWYVTANEAEIRVSDQVQIYQKAMGQWISGEESLKTALALGQTMTVYYDRTVTTGAQIRVIVVEK